jgi:hypothetical protein
VTARRQRRGDGDEATAKRQRRGDGEGDEAAAMARQRRRRGSGNSDGDEAAARRLRRGSGAATATATRQRRRRGSGDGDGDEAAACNTEEWMELQAYSDAQRSSVEPHNYSTYRELQLRIFYYSYAKKHKSCWELVGSLFATCSEVRVWEILNCDRIRSIP